MDKTPCSMHNRLICLMHALDSMLFKNALCMAGCAVEGQEAWSTRAEVVPGA